MTTARVYGTAPRALLVLAAYAPSTGPGNRARIARIARIARSTTNHQKGNR
jgi:hypothetical protein